MNLYSELYDSLNISDEDVALFRNDNPGFCGFDTLRVSRFLVAQLSSVRKHRTFNSFSVTDVIQKLEGAGRNGCVRGEEPFTHLPLKGFCKAHFFDARFLMRNLVNYWGLEYKDSPKFDALCLRVAAKEEKNPSPYGWQGRLAHELTICGYKEKTMQKGKRKGLTGEWIIFSKHEGKNYYLCIAKHSSSKEDDEKIYVGIKKLCEPEYPFLFVNSK